MENEIDSRKISFQSGFNTGGEVIGNFLVPPTHLLFRPRDPRSQDAVNVSFYNGPFSFPGNSYLNNGKRENSRGDNINSWKQN